MNDNAAEILLYGFIKEGEINALNFVNELSQLERSNSKIKVRINSGGGSIFDGLTIFNALRNSSATIDTYVDGVAASMGSVIAMAGKKCYMSKSAMFMTHKASGVLAGTADDMRNYAVLMERLEEIICDIYAQKTGLTTEAAKAKYLTGVDRWLTAQQALNERIIDGIYDAPQNIHVPHNLSDISQLVGFYNSYLPKGKNVFAHSVPEPGKAAKEQLLEALNDKIITSDLYMQLITDFKDKPNNLSNVIGTLYKNKIDLVYFPMDWNELDRAGVLEMIKRKNLPLFLTKYREKFNKEYGSK